MSNPVAAIGRTTLGILATIGAERATGLAAFRSAAALVSLWLAMLATCMDLSRPGFHIVRG